MKKTKLYQVLSSFDSYELNRLEKFIQSPYFNKNEFVQKYAFSLQKHLKKKNDGIISREMIWNEIYPNTPLDEIRFRKLTADLLQLVIQFLGVEKYQQEHLTQANFMLDAIQEKDLPPLHNSTIKLAQRISKRHFYRNSAYYYQQYLLEKNIFNLKDFDKKRATKSNIEQLNLMEIMEHLDYFYLGEKLRYYSAILTWDNLYKLDEEILFMEEIMKYVQSSDLINIPSIATYYYIILLMKEPEKESNYFVLKDLVSNNLDLFNKKEQKELFGALINFSIRRLNIGSKSFLREAFDNYKLGLNNQYLYINNNLSHFLFKNIVTIGLRLNEFDWIANFIKNYKDKLDSEIKDSTVAYNMASLHFYKKEWGKVLELLREVEIPELYYNLGAKTILMATYYELKEWDALDAFLHSFRVYLNRNKHLEIERKKRYLNLISLVKKLSLISYKDKSEIEKLYEEIKEAKVPSKNWLMDSISIIREK